MKKENILESINSLKEKITGIDDVPTHNRELVLTIYAVLNHEIDVDLYRSALEILHQHVLPMFRGHEKYKALKIYLEGLAVELSTKACNII